MNWFNLYAKIYDPFMKLFRLYKPDLIIKYLKPASKQIILDVGGGTGYLSNRIRPKVKRVIVLDESKNMLNQAKKYPDLEICEAKAQKMPFADNYFDSVICTDALHHIKDMDKTITEIKRVLKKNGTVLIYEFDINGLKGMLLWLFEKIYIDNSKFIKPSALLSKMKAQNFAGRVIRISKIEYIYIGKRK